MSEHEQRFRDDLAATERRIVALERDEQDGARRPDPLGHARKDSVLLHGMKQRAHDLRALLADLDAARADAREQRKFADTFQAYNEKHLRERNEARADLARVTAERFSWMDRAQDLAAKLARAEAALGQIARNTCCDRCQEAALVARAYFAEQEPRTCASAADRSH